MRRGAMVDPDCYSPYAWDSRALPWLVFSNKNGQLNEHFKNICKKTLRGLRVGEKGKLLFVGTGVPVKLVSTVWGNFCTGTQN